MTRVNTKFIKRLGSRILEVSDQYYGKKKGEFWYDVALILLAKLSGVAITRQIKLSSAKHPERIDFKTKGNNPTLIELAVRETKKKKSAISIRANLSELRKLRRYRGPRVAQRFLLLIDDTRKPIGAKTLETKYKNFAKAPRKGRPFKQSNKSVTVVFVSRKHQHAFTLR